MEWSLIQGPGARLADLLPFLVPAPGGDTLRVERVVELATLLRPARGVERLMLDADLLPLEDVGLVRAWLRSDARRELVLAGDDATRRVARTLLAEARTRWLAWPPDLDDLKRLARAPGATPSTETAPRADDAARTHEPALEGPMDALGEELSQIEAILGAPLARRRAAQAESASTTLERAPSTTGIAAPTSAPRASDAPPRAAAAPFGADAPRRAHEDDELELPPIEAEDLPPLELEPHPGPRTLPSARSAAADVAPSAPSASGAPMASTPAGASEPNASSVAPLPHASTTPSEPPARAAAPWFQDQVADLADLAQRIELGLTQVREEAQSTEESAEALGAPLDELTQDVARLLQFTRTLGFLVAPPARGAQRFDLGELVDVFTRALVERGTEGPRCLARKSGAVPVRSDRQLVAQALDALFFLAGHAAAAGEIVRVRLDARAPDAALTVEFPAGPLGGLDPARILEPYALRRIFPELGANALAAAAGILRGQGGSLALASKGPQHFEFTVRLPLAVDDGAHEHDPFA